MRILSLDLGNIGPFVKGHIDFTPDEENTEKPSVTIITGENGTGKTIVLDAIRGVLGAPIGRNIARSDVFSVLLNFNWHGVRNLSSNQITRSKDGYSLFVDRQNLYKNISDKVKPWLLDYWSSNIASDSFEIKNLSVPDPYAYLANTLLGIHKNIEITQIITYFDYLKSSENTHERALGETLYQKLKEIFDLCLNDGELKYVARVTLEPIVTQNGTEVALNNLSSGNLYLVQRMVSMLGKMYAVNVLNNQPLEELCQAPGLLLIDEAENHLHPKWQKTFINNILKVFPNLQIVLTTHSPFIVASVENARIYVCESRTDHSVIVDQTDQYANKPIDEILLTPLFDTQPFNEKISELIEKRKKAIHEGNETKRQEIEERLKAINPEYFAYFDVEDLLENITSKQ